MKHWPLGIFLRFFSFLPYFFGFFLDHHFFIEMKAIELQKYGRWENFIYKKYLVMNRRTYCSITRLWGSTLKTLHLPLCEESSTDSAKLFKMYLYSLD